MALRSTSSNNQPPPPFYSLHTVGAHRNTHRASVKPAPPPEQYWSLGIVQPSVWVTSGRRIDSVYSTGTGPNTQITDSVTQAVVRLQIAPPGL